MLTEETVRRISGWTVDGLPVVSVYARVTNDDDARVALRSRLSNLVHQLRPLTEDETLGHRARTSVREDIERIDTGIRWDRPLPHGVAIFSCSAGGLFETVDLPRTVRDRVVVDSTPWVRPLMAILDEYHRYCVVVLDRGAARVFEVFLGDVREHAHVDDAHPRRRDWGGWAGLAEHRVRNRADELAKKHFRHVVAQVDALFRYAGCELLVVGGHEDELAGFLDYLPRHVRSKVAGTFDVDLHTATPAGVRRAAEDVVARWEREEERRLVAEVLDTEAAGGLATTGVDACLWAASVAAVGTLLLHDEVSVPGVVCDESGWLGRTGDSCPVCGRPTRPTSDVLDELVAAVVDDGGAVEHVHAATELERHSAAALLRFRPPPPGT